MRGLEYFDRRYVGSYGSKHQVTGARGAKGAQRRCGTGRGTTLRSAINLTAYQQET